MTISSVSWLVWLRPQLRRFLFLPHTVVVPPCLSRDEARFDENSKVSPTRKSDKDKSKWEIVIEAWLFYLARAVSPQGFSRGRPDSSRWTSGCTTRGGTKIFSTFLSSSETVQVHCYTSSTLLKTNCSTCTSLI